MSRYGFLSSTWALIGILTSLNLKKRHNLFLSNLTCEDPLIALKNGIKKFGGRQTLQFSTSLHLILFFKCLEPPCVKVHSFIRKLS